YEEASPDACGKHDRHPDAGRQQTWAALMLRCTRASGLMCHSLPLAPGRPQHLTSFGQATLEADQ
ncbi:hypothetical protein, partial [Psychrobacter sp. 16-MNA-CIBAN-0192]|uniref:hypothetical protein n=1 Tax=Psychrobacter sp. 16-MNA-CIBAN-0192 TaxID=3140448 RepID=UPI00331E75A5